METGTYFKYEIDKIVSLKIYKSYFK